MDDMQDVAIAIREKQKPVSLFVHRLAQEAHAGGLQACMRGIEIVHQNGQMADAPGSSNFMARPAALCRG